MEGQKLGPARTFLQHVVALQVDAAAALQADGGTLCVEWQFA